MESRKKSLRRKEANTITMKLFILLLLPPSLLRASAPTNEIADLSIEPVAPVRIKLDPSVAEQFHNSLSPEELKRLATMKDDARKLQRLRELGQASAPASRDFRDSARERHRERSGTPVVRTTFCRVFEESQHFPVNPIAQENLASTICEFAKGMNTLVTCQGNTFCPVCGPLDPRGKPHTVHKGRGLAAIALKRVSEATFSAWLCLAASTREKRIAVARQALGPEFTGNTLKALQRIHSYSWTCDTPLNGD